MWHSPMHAVNNRSKNGPELASEHHRITHHQAIDVRAGQLLRTSPHPGELDAPRAIDGQAKTQGCEPVTRRVVLRIAIYRRLTTPAIGRTQGGPKSGPKRVDQVCLGGEQRIRLQPGFLKEAVVVGEIKHRARQLAGPLSPAVRDTHLWPDKPAVRAQVDQPSAIVVTGGQRNCNGSPNDRVAFGSRGELLWRLCRPTIQQH